MMRALLLTHPVTVPVLSFYVALGAWLQWT